MNLLYKNLYKSDCAIVATYNSFVWTGQEIPYEYISKLAGKFGYSKNRGIRSNKINKILSNLNAPVRSIQVGTTLSDIILKIKSGQAMLVWYRHIYSSTAHITIVVPTKKGNIKLINPERYYKNWEKLVNHIVNGEAQFACWAINKRRYYDDQRSKKSRY